MAFLREDIVSIEDPVATLKFRRLFLQYLERYYTDEYNELILLCIGTDRATGDSLGPLIGYKFEKKVLKFDNVHIYGTLDKPVHARNLEETIAFIYKTHNKPFIVAIDACLGRTNKVGCILISHGPLNPGAGVNKVLPSVGDINIRGIVNMGGFMEYVILQNTRLSIVMNMADVIADGIYFALWEFMKAASPMKKLAAEIRVKNNQA